MTHGIRFDINKLNRNRVKLHIYRTTLNNLDSHGDIINARDIEEVAIIDQDEYDKNYSGSKKNNKYIFYDIEENLFENWSLNDTSKLCQSAIEYKSFLVFNDIPDVYYEITQNKMSYIKPEVVIPPDHEYVYFILGYVDNKLAGDSRRLKTSKYIRCSIPSDINLEYLSYSIYLKTGEENGEEQFELIDTVTDMNNNLLLPNYYPKTYIFDNQTINENDSDVKINHYNNDFLITIPNVLTNSEFTEKYNTMIYPDSNYKMITTYNTVEKESTKLLDTYEFQTDISIIRIEIADHNTNIYYHINLFSSRLATDNPDLFRELNTNITSNVANIKFTKDDSLGTNNYNASILYDDNSSNIEYINMLIPCQLLPSRYIEVSFYDSNNNKLETYHCASPYPFSPSAIDPVENEFVPDIIYSMT